MATRKELLKAHSFTSQRLVNALVTRNPDEPQPPLRRIRTGTLVGALIGTLVTAGFGVWGLLDPGANQSWREKTNVPVLDKTTGVAYVYDDKRVLHPTPNLASALLATMSGDVQRLGSRSLADIPRGVPIGIPAAPAELPEEKMLKALPLRVCSGAPQQGVKGDTKGARPTTLEFGSARPGTTNVPVLLANEQGDLVLVLDGIKHLLPNNRATAPTYLTKLGFAPIRTGQAFINAIPEGTPLTRLKIAGEGEPYTADERLARMLGSAARVGRWGSTPTVDGGRQYWVLQRDGFSGIGFLDAELMRADGIDEIGNLTDEMVNADQSEQYRVNSGNIPQGVPQAPAVKSSDTTVCATWGAGSGAPVISVGDKDIPTLDKPANPTARTADRVVVPPGRGALVQNDSIQDARGASYLIVGGLRYPVPDEATRQVLGYRAAPVRVPAQVIELVPDGLPGGVVLNQAEARTQLG